MASGSSESPLSGLLRFATVPLCTEDERSFQQQRLALFAQVMFMLLSGAMILVLLGGVVLYEYTAPRGNLGRLPHLGACAIFALAWLSCRRGKLSPTWLAVIDGTCTSIAGALVSAMILWAPSILRPEFGAILAITFMLVWRAAIVPSTPLRTAVVGFKSVIFVPFVTWWIHAHGNDPPALPPPLVLAVAAGGWAVIAIVLTSLTTRVIYGLTERAREAIQLGQYTLEEPIGEGAMGVVYRARHAMLRRPTAVKLLPAGKAGEVAIARFEREVQITSQLSHPNTIAIYDFGRTPGGIFYYAMEYLEGWNLEDVVALDGAQPPGRVIHILQQVAGALAEAHAKHLIHRDVKPANIILCERGGQPDVAKVVDFGLVKDIGAQTEVAVSQVNTITGTPLYLSPEAIRSPESVSAKSDLYALGAVGYFLLTGVHVFDAPTLVEVCSHHLHTRPRPLAEHLGRSAPPDLEAILLQCLEKDPERRPLDADAVHDALLACADAGSWTQQNARVWWRDRGARLATSRPRRRPVVEASVSATLAVDLRSRLGVG